MKLSIVIPILNEEDNLPILRERLEKVMLDGQFDYEIIIVDDGSIDQSPQLTCAWIQDNPKVTLLQLSRNFGHQPAITAGLKETTGDAVVIMDADLQDPPQVILEMVQKWREGYRVVLAERLSRKEIGLRRLVIEGFYKFFEFISDFPVKIKSGVFGLMDRVVVDHLLSFPEQNRFIPGLRSWIGFSTTSVHYMREARAKGAPKQSIRRLIKYGIDATFSFSYKPLRMSFFMGLFISAICFIYGIILLVKRLLNIDVVPGFTTIAIAVLFLSGVLLISNGIIGEYLARIYDEVKKRPLYIVARKMSRKENQKELNIQEYSSRLNP